MDCKISGSKPSQTAMTLVEVLVATGIGSMIFAALCSLTLYSARSFQSMIDYRDLNKSSRIALDNLSKEIRQSRGLTNIGVTNLTFNVDSGTMVLSYNKPAGEVRLVGRSQPLLSDCTSFTWQLFDRYSTPTTNVASCKMVQFDWTCARGIAGRMTRSATAGSMKIVIRKMPN